MLDQTHRKEGMQRIQIGLAGLGGVLLLIGLANVVVDNVRRDDAAAEAALDETTNAGNAEIAGDQPSEPLAELGVTPSSESDSETSVVADLQPDPNLRKPMDRPPPVTRTVPDPQQAPKPAQ